MSPAATGDTLLHDLRRMGAVWALVAVTAFIAVFSIRAAGQRHLSKAMLGAENPCDVAEVYLNAGIRAATKLVGESARGIAGGGALDRTLLGALKGDEELLLALGKLETAAQLCSSDPKPWPYLHETYFLNGEEALALHALGRHELLSGRTGPAAVQFRMALAVDGKCLPARIDLVAALRQDRRLDEALELIEGHEEQIRQAPRGQAALGGVLLALRRIEEALPPLEAALTADPSDETVIGDLYGLYTDLGQAARGAGFFYNTGVDSKRGSAVLFNMAAALYAGAGDAAGEVKALRRAVDLFPNNVALNWQLAVALSKLGEKAEARDVANRAVEIDLDYVLSQVTSTGIDPRTP